MDVNFGGTVEDIVTREEFTIEHAREVQRHAVIAILGYGSQAPGQSLNLREQGFNVIIGQRKCTESFEKAVEDGWNPDGGPDRTLYSLEEAASRGTIVANLLSDAGQMLTADQVLPHLTKGKAYYSSHGFGVHFKEHTRLYLPSDIDVIMVAPKGTGSSVRTNFLNGAGVNSSYAIEQDVTGRAKDRVLAMGVGIGSGYLFPTTHRNEVVSDLFGERAFLLGEIWALAEASYDRLRQAGLGAKEAFIQSSEQATQVILPLIGEGGAKEIYDRARAAGQLGTVLEYQRAVQEGTQRILNELYTSVETGVEAQIALATNSDPDYRSNLTRRLKELDSSEMWSVGKEVRADREDQTYGKQISNWGLAGAILGAMTAQYQKLIAEGHKPSEAFNESVEEMTQSLNNFYKDKGIAHLLGACSTTAQVGSLEWGPKFKAVLLPIFQRLKPSYSTGSLDLASVGYSSPNLWTVGDVSRTLRPENLKAG